jgi:hypothetical protein
MIVSELSHRVIVKIFFCLFLFVFVYLVDSAFCVFAHSENDISQEESDAINNTFESLVINAVCPSVQSCRDEIVLLGNYGCNELNFNIYKPKNIVMDNDLKNKIVFFLLKSSKSDAVITFYNEEFKPCLFCFFSANYRLKVERS